MTSGALEPGGRIGPYRLEREVGRGAMGIVFQARDPGDACVALKVLVPPPLLPVDDRTALQSRFLREARALSAVRHPNVVYIAEVGEADGHLFLAMEYLEGENLRQTLAREGPLPPPRAVALLLQLCGALDAVHHAGIVHRDVKPENAVLLPDGTVKLTDFGIARLEGEATLTRTGGILGSPAYMAPEQILGQGVDRRSDVFAAAVTLYQLLTDRLPFPGGSLLEIAHNVVYSDPLPLEASVPPGLAAVVLRGLRRSPGARYATAGEFAVALRHALPSPVGVGRGQAPGAAPDAAEATLVDRDACCARHPHRRAVGLCNGCHRPLCRQCARGEGPPHFCALHRPVTLFGISTVRLEVAAAALVFLLLLLCLSPLGYGLLRR